MTNYLVYDVFTDTAFGGNQLAVIPDASALPEGDLQKIAREFNFSETTFVFPATDPAHTAKVRIFTPTMEIPFAGHPTIGTAIALRELGHTGNMVLELGIGPIPCSFDGKTASFTISAALEQIAQPDTALVAAALGLTSEQISTTTHAPVQASLGQRTDVRPPRQHPRGPRDRQCGRNINGAFDGNQRHRAKPDNSSRRRYGAAFNHPGANDHGHTGPRHNQRSSGAHHARAAVP